MKQRNFEEFDRSKLKLLPLAQRQSKMTLTDIMNLAGEAKVFVAASVTAEITALAQKIVRARQLGRPVIWLMGAHVLRRGNSRFIIDLMEREIITHLATNGSVAIHDFELAFWGATLEDVEFYIKDGRFGNWEETGKHVNEAVIRGFKDGIGFGESIGKMIEYEECGNIPHKEISIFAAAYRLGVPVTVHKGIGYDITDQHPSADFAAIGKTSGDDFLIFANSIAKLEGGVFLSLGSQVMGPEVYLKALSIARNLACQQGRGIKHFATAVFDLVSLGNWQGEKNIVNYRKTGVMSDPRYYFRPLKSILIRTVKDGGRSFYIQGDFKHTVPCLYHKIVKILGRKRKELP